MDIAFTETIVKIEYSESNQDAAIKPPDFDSHSNQVHKVKTKRIIENIDLVRLGVFSPLKMIPRLFRFLDFEVNNLLIINSFLSVSACVGERPVSCMYVFTCMFLRFNHFQPKYDDSIEIKIEEIADGKTKQLSEV